MSGTNITFIRVLLALSMANLVLAFSGDYTKLVFRDCGSRGMDIDQVNLIPMPVYNPGEAFFTFAATLKRPIGILETSINIFRSISGITLPIRCYIIDGIYVGSCTYPDLCNFLRNKFDEFRPELCPTDLLPFGIDCTCPFKIPPQRIDIVNAPYPLPDVSETILRFLHYGNFNITIIARDRSPAASQPYMCANFLFTVKQAKPGH